MGAGDFTFQLDHNGIGALLVSPEMHAMVDRITEEAVPFAKAISPDAAPYGAGYVDSFVVEKGLEENMTARRGRRAAARIVNTSPYAAAVEYGWDLEHKQFADHPGYYVLAKTADHIGGIV